MTSRRAKLEEENVTGVLATSMESNDRGRRKISLTKAERQDLWRQQLAEAAAALFLDLEKKHKWKDIAAELDISLNTLRDITKSKEFDTAYNALFAELGHDPRYRAAQAHLSDMLPTAIYELGRIVDGSSGAAPSIQLRAITKVIELNGLTGHDNAVTSREDLAQFLQDMRVAASPKVVPPEEYQQAMDDAGIVDGEYTESVASEP